MADRFTVYDIFAVLVPGAVFNFLMAVTLKHFADSEIFAWSGGFGDATVLIITGYASGVLLQALGNAFTESSIWQQKRGGPATMSLLLPDTMRCTEEFKHEALAAIEKHYGPLPAVTDATYQRVLRERAFRVYKQVAADDPAVSRFLAEHHQMRAYAVAFFLLTVMALATIPLGGDLPVLAHLALAVGFAGLSCLAIWRMEDKDEVLGVHVLTRYLETARRAKT